MLYKTHKAAGVLACLVSYDIMKNSGLLASDISPIVQLAVIYPACSWASTAPDLDHALCNVKEQTPLNILINKLLHIKKCTHRSVQTHSVLFTGGFCLILLLLVQLLSFKPELINNSSLSIVRLMIVGITIGIASHLIMDSLSTAGIWLVPNIKFRLVPDSTAFKTGGIWETVIRYLVFLAVAYFAVHILLDELGISLMVGNLRFI